MMLTNRQKELIMTEYSKPKTSWNEILTSIVSEFNRQFRSEHFVLLGLCTFGLAIGVIVGRVPSRIPQTAMISLLMWSSGANIALAIGLKWAEVRNG